MKAMLGRMMFMTLCLLIGGAFFSATTQAATKGEINASVKASKDRFIKDVKGANEYLKVAKGLLVIPNVAKAGFVVGGQYGTGALQVGGKTVGYYNLAGASFGFQAGVEKFDLIILFVTNEALKKFQTSKGWEAGVDAEITMVNVGADATVETLRSQDPVVGFVIDQKGLMGGVSVKGAKFTKTQLK
jgi:lipid-binding SYLF domain-containing protein